MASPLRRVLDLPCGTGRFADSLSGLDFEHLTIADNSPGMLARAVAAFEAVVVPENATAAAAESATYPKTRFDARLLSAFDIDLPDNSVDFIACMRFFHHLAYAEDRQSVLAEFRRISNKESMLAVSLWVDGNLGSWRRSRKSTTLRERGFGRRRVVERAVIEQEFSDAGYTVIKYWDMWPGLTMWRQYLLQLP